MMSRVSHFMSAGVLVSISGAAIAQPDHIFLTEENGNLATGLWVDTNPDQLGPPNAAGGDITPGVSAFSEQMGGIPGFGPQNAGQTIHPGIFGDAPGVTIGVNVVDALRVWDGEDFDEISGDDAGETRMQIAGFTTPLGDNPVSPATGLTPTAADEFLFLDDDWITAGSVIDEHLQFTLTDTGGNILNEADANAISEIFLVSLQFTSTTLGSTEPIFLTLGQNVSDAELAEAQSFVQNVIVPAPGGAVALAGLGVVAARRRR